MPEVYRIGVEIALTGTIMQGLEAISSKLLGIHTKVKDVEGGFRRWGLALAGAGALLGADKIVHGLATIVEHGAKFEHFVAQARAAGLTSAEVSQATSAAWQNVGRNIGADAAESLKNVLELRQATGSLEESMKMLPAFTLTSNALGSLKDEGLKHHLTDNKQAYNFARSMELMGVTTDPEKLASYTQTMTREMIGLRGLVDGNTFNVGVQNAGGARYGWNEDFVGRVLGPLLQMSPRNGFGLYQMDRSLNQGVMTEMMAGGLEKYGLYNKSDEIRIGGRFKGMKVGSIAGADQMTANPEEWALKTVLPSMKSHGVDINNTDEMRKAINEMSRGNKNLGSILDELLLPLSRSLLAKERANIDAVPNDAAANLNKQDPMQAMQNFHKAWDSLLTALGAPAVETAVKVLNSITSGINAMAVSAAAHPEAVKIGLEAMAGLAGALALFGGGAIIAAAAALAPGGAIALGIVGLAGAFAAVVGINWSSIPADLKERIAGIGNALAFAAKIFWEGAKGLGEAIKALADAFGPQLLAVLAALPGQAMRAMDSIAKALGDAIASIPGKVAGAIAGMAAGISSAIGNAVKGAAAGALKGLHDPSSSGEYSPSAFRPAAGGSSRPVHVQSVLNVDGKRMASVVTKHQIAAHEHPRQAPYKDAGSDFASLDYGFTTG